MDLSERDGLPKFFWARSSLSMDALKGPDEQYRAGARDMWALVRDHLSEVVGPVYYVHEHELNTEPWDDPDGQCVAVRVVP